MSKAKPKGSFNDVLKVEGAFFRFRKLDTYTWVLERFENGVVSIEKTGLLAVCFHVFKTIVLRGDK